MNHRRRALALSIIIICFLLLQSTAFASAAAPPPGGEFRKYYVNGYVRDSNTLNAIWGATVQIFLDGVLRGSRSTDINGYFSYSTLWFEQPYYWKVIVSKSGYDTETRIKTATGTTTSMGYIYLNPSAPDPPIPPVIGTPLHFRISPTEVTITVDSPIWHYSAYPSWATYVYAIVDGSTYLMDANGNGYVKTVTITNLYESFDYCIKAKENWYDPDFEINREAIAYSPVYTIDGWPVFHYTDWEYWQPHIINGAPGAGTGYQVRFWVNRDYGPTEGEKINCHGECKSDFGDIRFVDSKGRLLSYWKEYQATDNGYALFWVKIEDDLNYDSLIYILYGNENAEYAGDGESVFLAFDDFEGDLSKWDVTVKDLADTWQIDPAPGWHEGNAAHYADLIPNTMVASTSFPETISLALHVDFYYEIRALQFRGNIVEEDSWASEGAFFTGARSAWDWQYMTSNGNFDYEDGLRPEEDTWYSLEWRADAGTNTFDFGVCAASTPRDYQMHSGSLVRGDITAGFDLWRFYGYNGVFDMDEFYLDNFYVRNFIENGPTHGSWAMSSGFRLPNLGFVQPVINEGFESGTSQWAEISTDVQWDDYTGDPHKENHSLGLSAEAFKITGIEQCLLAEISRYIVGQEVAFSFYFKSTEVDRKDIARAYIRIVQDGISTTHYGPWKLQNFEQTSPWFEVLAIATIPDDLQPPNWGSDEIYVGMEIARTDDQGPSVYVDSCLFAVHQHLLRNTANEFGQIGLVLNVEEVKESGEKMLATISVDVTGFARPGYYIQALNLDFYEVGPSQDLHTFQHHACAENNQIDELALPSLEEAEVYDRQLAAVVGLGVGLFVGSICEIYSAGMSTPHFTTIVMVAGEITESIIMLCWSGTDEIYASHNWGGFSEPQPSMEWGSLASTFEWGCKSRQSEYCLRVSGMIRWATIDFNGSYYYLRTVGESQLDTFIYAGLAPT